MKKRDICEGVIEGMDFPDKGWLWIEDRKVSIRYALPGQKVRFRISKLKRGKAEGTLLEVLEPSRRECVSGACAHSGICGGCLYQTLPYEEQLKIKAAQVHELIGPVMEKYMTENRESAKNATGQCSLKEWGAAERCDGILPSPLTEGYRNKMEFSFGDMEKDGPLALGMHRRGSFYDIVTVTDCRIVHEDFRKILQTALTFFKEEKLPFYRKMQHTGYLRHLLVRRAVKTEEILICLVVSSQYPSDQERTERQMLRAFARKMLDAGCQGTIAGILHMVNDSLADVVQSDQTEVLYGQDYFYEELLGLQFKITPFSFFQTNSLGAEVLYSTVREYVNMSADVERPLVFDLYSGTGTIAQLLAPASGSVVGVEIVEEAVRAARENAARNGLTNCTFLAADVLKALDKIPQKPDYIILDPPREGIHPKALEKIIAYGVRNMVYISCKPTSLARDLDMLLAAGYVVKRWRMVDMFPGSGNVETVCLLTRIK